MNRTPILKSIADEYHLLAGKMLQKKTFMKPTSIGYFAGARIDDIHDIFEKIHLEKYKKFIDLGSGDGRVVLMAAAYTNAVGVELDDELFATAQRMQKKLGVKHGALKKALFVKKNYLTDIHLGEYDVIFINPDNPLYELEKKLGKEMKKDAILIVYNAVYAPLNMKLKKTIGVGPSAGFVYTL
ncbi:MAG: methyltransferase [Candidatus Woesearchaeota archaeon]|nr:methyltransferase [Candidatus Woesearchaeota archaeon]